MRDPHTPDVEPSGDREVPAPRQEVEFDEVAFNPTGLDLARQIAEAAGKTVPAPPPRPKKRRRPGRRAREERRGDPMPLGDALERVIEQRGWSADVNVHLLMGRWAELVGPVVAEHSTPEAYTDKVLVVRTSSTAWASQLRLMAPQLVAKMNASLGDGTILRVQIIAPSAPSWKHGPRSVKGRGPRDTYG
mgnify:FL=1